MSRFYSGIARLAVHRTWMLGGIWLVILAAAAFGAGHLEKQLQVGGCQFKVSPGEEVLWAYDMFSKKHILELSGPRRVRAGKTFSVKVVDGQVFTCAGGSHVDRHGYATAGYRGRAARRRTAGAGRRILWS